MGIFFFETNYFDADQEILRINEIVSPCKTKKDRRAIYFRRSFSYCDFNYLNGFKG